MAETKYGKYIITETEAPSIHPRTEDHYQYNTLFIHEKMKGALEGAYYLETNMVRFPGEPLPVSKPHKHDFDEYIILMGTNPDDPHDLCGEVEFWLGGEEKHIINKTCAIFIPKGMDHCPFKFTRVDRPIIFVTTGNSNAYTQAGFSQDPKWKDLPDGNDGPRS